MAIQDNQQEEPAGAEEIMAAFRSRQWEAEAERDRSHWVIATAVVAAGLALGWWALKHQAPSASRQPVAPNPIVTVAPEPGPEPVPITTLRPTVTSPVAPRPAGQVAVYTCVQGDGQKVLSDRPCGADAVEKVIDTRMLNTYTESAQPPTVAVPPARRSAQGPDLNGSVPTVPSASSTAAKAQLCERIQARIDYINARMRKGYTSQEGEYWRGEWHKAKNAYYDAECGRP